MRRALLGLVVILLVAAGAFVAWAGRHGAINPIAPPARASFDAKLVERGELLAAIGYCSACHTRPGGEPFAGGLPLHTPFGVIHSTNITPDPETGIGAWSESAFQRAMHEGVDRAGRHLYPAFPYDHFARVTADDVRAIYAFLMTRKPARYTPPANDLAFPFNVRFLVAGWKLLFFSSGPLKPNPAESAAWNRGAYIAEGLGHCGSCHTPRNALGGLRNDQKFGGGDVDGWHGPALNASSPAPHPWTKELLVDYFIKGRSPQHGIAAGPMTPVVDLLADQSDEDLEALATYILSFQNRPAATAEAALAFAAEREAAVAPAVANDPALQAGRAIFTQSCATCHRKGERSVALALASTVNGPDPRNLVRIIEQGIRPPRGSREYSMPPFAWIKDDDLASLVAFVRSQFSRNPSWNGIGDAIREVRGKTSK